MSNGRIVHLSDIHIHNFQRHEEYRNVFNELYLELSKEKDIQLVVITGDLAHSKTNLTPEYFKIAYEFLRGLYNAVETDIIIIPGNHDANINNSDRLDAITPVVQAVNEFLVGNNSVGKIYFSRNSGIIYQNQLANFVHFSCLDDNWDFEIPDDKLCIGLFHGVVDGAVLDNGFVMKNEDIKTIRKYLDAKCDYVMMGDIHKKQFVSDKMYYAGSLIQQNFGEEYPQGYSVWNFSNGKLTIEQRFLQSSIPYYTISAKQILNGQLPELKSNCRVRVVGDLDKPLTSELQREIVSLLPNGIKPIFKDEYSDSEQQKNDVENYSKNHKDFLQSYVIEKMDLSPHLLGEMLSEYDKLYSAVYSDLNDADAGAYNNLTRWKIINIEWENLFSYKGKNTIDFIEDFGTSGIISLSGANRSGKSSILDVILFALYGTPSKKRLTNKDIVNNQSKSGYAKLTLEMDSVQYVINRTVNNKGSTTVSFSSDSENLNQIDKNNTDKKIIEYFGSMNDLMFTSVTAQFDINVFLDNSSKDKMVLLQKFMGLDLIEGIHKKSSDEVKKLSMLYDETKYSLLQNEIMTSETDNAQLLLKRAELDVQIKDLKEIVQQFNEIEKELLKQYKSASLNNSIEKVKHNGEFIAEWSLERQTEEMGRLKIQLNETNKTIDDCKTQLDNIELQKIENERRSLSQELAKLREEYRVKGLTQMRLQSQIESIESDIAIGQKQSACMSIDPQLFNKCGYTLQVIEKTNKLVELKENLRKILGSNDNEERLNLLEGELLSVETILEEQQKKREILNISLKHNLGVQQNLQQVIGALEQLQLYLTEKRENELLEKELAEIGVERGDFQNQLDSLLNIQRDIDLTKIRLETIIENNTKQVKQLEQYKEKFRVFKCLSDATSYNGIQREIINYYIPTLNQKINDVLRQVVDFEVEFRVEDGKRQTIGLYLLGTDGTVPLEAGSGSEKTLSALAIKYAFSTFGNRPIANFYFVDEVFGTIDPNLINEVEKMLNCFNGYFEYVVVITHDERIQDFCNKFLLIEKRNGISKIVKGR